MVLVACIEEASPQLRDFIQMAADSTNDMSKAINELEKALRQLPEPWDVWRPCDRQELQLWAAVRTVCESMNEERHLYPKPFTLNSLP